MAAGRRIDLLPIECVRSRNLRIARTSRMNEPISTHIPPCDRRTGRSTGSRAAWHLGVAGLVSRACDAMVMRTQMRVHIPAHAGMQDDRRTGCDPAGRIAACRCCERVLIMLLLSKLSDAPVIRFTQSNEKLRLRFVFSLVHTQQVAHRHQRIEVTLLS